MTTSRVRLSPSALGLSLGLLGAAGVGGCQPMNHPVRGVDPHAQDTGGLLVPATSSAPRFQRPAGVPVPGTRVVVPREATAGGRLLVIAPSGSRIDFAGAQAQVPAEGEVLLDVPAIHGNSRLTVDRPDGRRLSFQVRIR